MEVVCPDVGDLVTCFTCKDQAVPPFRLCLDSHATCSTCPKYLRRCVCGEPFAPGPHTHFDCLIAAMRLRCKYGSEVRGKADGRCARHKWYTVQELDDHYRGECAGNAFACQLDGCGRVCRVETVTEHYESAHGPFARITPTDPRYPNSVSFCIL